MLKGRANSLNITVITEINYILCLSIYMQNKNMYEHNKGFIYFNVSIH